MFLQEKLMTKMAPKTQAHFYLSPEALAVIERRAQSPNKRGDWLSKAVVEYDALLADAERVSDVATLVALLQRLVRKV